MGAQDAHLDFHTAPGLRPCGSCTGLVEYLKLNELISFSDFVYFVAVFFFFFLLVLLHGAC